MPGTGTTPARPTHLGLLITGPYWSNHCVLGRGKVTFRLPLCSSCWFLPVSSRVGARGKAWVLGWVGWELMMGEEGWGLRWRPCLWHEGVWAERPVSFQDLLSTFLLSLLPPCFLGKFPTPKPQADSLTSNARGEREISLNCLLALWLF